MNAIRILLADDHVLVRAGLRRILESFPGAEVVAEADDGDQVADLVALHRPDVVVTDLSMQRASGFDVIRGLKREHPEVHVIVVSMHADATRVSSWFSRNRAERRWKSKSARRWPRAPAASRRVSWRR